MHLKESEIDPVHRSSFLQFVRTYELPVLFLSFVLSLCGAFFLEASFVAALSLAFSLGCSILICQRMHRQGVVYTAIILSFALLIGASAGLGLFAELSMTARFMAAVVILLLFVGFSLASLDCLQRQDPGEASLEARDSFMQRVFNSLPVGVSVCLDSGESVFTNMRWAEFTSQRSERILLKDSTGESRHLENGWDSLVQVLAECDLSSAYQSLELVSGDDLKHQFSLFSMALHLDHLGEDGFLHLLIDETATAQYKAAHLIDERRLNLALQSASMGIWEQDVADGCVHLDANALQFLNIDQDVYNDETDYCDQLVHPDDHETLKDRTDAVRDGRETSVCLEYRIINSKGDCRWIQDFVQAVDRNAEGLATKMLGTLQDITERKQVEIDLQIAKEKAEQASEAKSEFVAMVSHEIRTPLNAIIGLSSFLVESKLNPDDQELVESIDSSAKNLLRLVNDVLDFSKIEANRMELEVNEFPLISFIEESLRLFRGNAESKGLKLSSEVVDLADTFVLADMTRLRQVLNNLLGNALKFTDEGGVHVHVRRCWLKDIPVEHRPEVGALIGYLDRPDCDYIEISVEDTGIGVAAEQVDKLFEAFTQADRSISRLYGGTGLGLTICKSLVQAMGGAIWLEQGEKAGSVFRFVVRAKLFNPDLDEETGEVLEFVDKADAFARPSRILVVGRKQSSLEVVKYLNTLNLDPKHARNFRVDDPQVENEAFTTVLVSLEYRDEAFEFIRQILMRNDARPPQRIIGFASDGVVVPVSEAKQIGVHAVIAVPSESDQLSDVLV